MKATARRLPVFIALCILPRAGPTHGAEVSPGRGEPRWTNGLPQDETYFPIGVWLQNPRNAPRCKAAGINLYVGLWSGPTAEQIGALEKAAMRVICGQNPVALASKDNPVIAGWMHGDEPDNAQSLGSGKGFGPPIAPERIVADYTRLRATDPTRPVLLNLGQGVAWDNYIGRGVRRNHPEDYPEYAKGCDIASFDIYPAVHGSPEIAGKLEYVARGVERLVRWTGGEKLVWNCIECTHIDNAAIKPTPEQVRAEVWMALIRGSQGLIYFVHQFKPSFKEAALLDDPKMLAAVTAINAQVRELAPVLNRPTVSDAVAVEPSSAETEVAFMVKQQQGTTYLFAVNLRNQPAQATFRLGVAPGASEVKVLGETRTIPLRARIFADTFGPYQVHLYRLKDPDTQSK
ncbi:MAG: hypothetical protein JWM59_1426 [Verrucomicrobiales bacterium]|nr:hypothetical protein [Verrucomicrobiales bacterium]